MYILQYAFRSALVSLPYKYLRWKVSKMMWSLHLNIHTYINEKKEKKRRNQKQKLPWEISKGNGRWTTRTTTKKKKRFLVGEHEQRTG